MLIRLVSDLHVDINRDILQQSEFWFCQPQEIKNTDVLCIAGDVAGNLNDTLKFIDKLIVLAQDHNPNLKILYVVGNHEPYDNFDNGTTRENTIKCIQETYKKSSRFMFLENEFVCIDDVIFTGSCLYTNFNDNMYSERMCPKSINDFRYVYTNPDERRRVCANDYIEWHIEAIEGLDCLCSGKGMQDKKIVVVSHFAPSLGSIHTRFEGSYLNNYFANNLDDFIKRHPNIKYWLHGHTHDPFNYVVGETQILCEPYGYFGYDPNTCLPHNYTGKIIQI